MKLKLTLTLSATILFCGNLYARGINKIDWSMHQFDAAHTGYIKVKLNKNNFKFHWKSTVGEDASQGLNYSISPAVTTDKLVFVSRSNYIFSNTLQAFSIDDGHEVWKISYGHPTVNPPSTDHKMVYIQTVNNSLGGTDFYGYNVKNGEIMFKTPFSAQWENYLAPTIYKSHVYANGGSYGGIYSFDKTTGQTDWFTPLSQYDMWTPAVNDNIAVAYTAGKLNVIERGTGKWLFDIVDPNYSWHGYSADSSPVLFDDHTAVIIQSGYLTLFDLDKKHVIKSFGPGYIGQPSTDGKLIFASKNNGLTIINAKTLREEWVWFKQNEKVNGQFVITDNQIFLTTNQNTYAINKNTHKEVWNYPASGSLSLARGHLFISSHSGYLEAIKVT